MQPPVCPTDSAISAPTLDGPLGTVSVTHLEQGSWLEPGNISKANRPLGRHLGHGLPVSSQGAKDQNVDNERVAIIDSAWTRAIPAGKGRLLPAG